jgi:hypothetical protein
LYQTIYLKGNINPLDAIESQDETHSSDSSDEESGKFDHIIYRYVFFFS